MKLSATTVLKNNKVISKEKFIEIYAAEFNLNIEEIRKEILFLKKKFKVKFTKLGPVIFVKLYNNKPQFCWGEYAILLNIYNLNKCISIGGEDPFVGDNPFAIHPNIHVDFGEDEFSGYKVCIGRHNIDPIYSLIKSCLITSACETIVDILNNTSEEDDLFEDFIHIHFSRCKSCGDVINVEEDTCEKCIKFEQNNTEEEIYSEIF